MDILDNDIGVKISFFKYKARFKKIENRNV